MEKYLNKSSGYPLRYACFGRGCSFELGRRVSYSNLAQPCELLIVLKNQVSLSQIKSFFGGPLAYVHQYASYVGHRLTDIHMPTNSRPPPLISSIPTGVTTRKMIAWVPLLLKGDQR